MEEIERTIMTALLAGSDPVLAQLRLQYAAASVKVRELSGVGFFTHYSVPEACPAVEPADFEVQDLHLELDGLKHGAGVVLFVRGGRLDMLEGFSYDEPWPEAPRLNRWSYLVRAPEQPQQLIKSDARQWPGPDRAPSA